MFVYQLVNARKALDKVSNYEGVEFAYAVFKNKQLIDKKMMEVDFIKNVSREVVEYEDKRVTMCENFAKKDEQGKPIIEKDLYLVEEEKQPEFKTKMEELFKEYRPFIEERQQQIDLFNKKMNDPIDFEFIKLKKDQIPPQIKTANELENISFMIE